MCQSAKEGSLFHIRDVSDGRVRFYDAASSRDVLVTSTSDVDFDEEDGAEPVVRQRPTAVSICVSFFFDELKYLEVSNLQSLRFGHDRSMFLKEPRSPRHARLSSLDRPKSLAKDHSQSIRNSESIPVGWGQAARDAHHLLWLDEERVLVGYRVQAVGNNSAARVAVVRLRDGKCQRPTIGRDL